MHINHRRKNKFRGKHHGYFGYPNVYSLKPFKVMDAQKRRARERAFMSNGKFDMLPIRFQKDLLWNYW